MSGGHRSGYAAMLRGDVAGAADLLERLDASDPVARSWAFATRAAGASIVPDRVEAPTIEELADLVDASGEARDAASVGCTLVVRKAAIELAPARARAWLELQAELAAGAPEDSEAWIAFELGRAWLAWQDGSLAHAEESLASIERRARARAAEAFVIDAAVLRALSAEARGEPAVMTSHARRASRMARAEALPIAEHLAHLVLARARRASRLPHLAIRILGALERVVPRPYRGWIQWERLLAGDALDLDPGQASSGAERASALLRDTLRAAMAGDQARFEAAAHELRDAVAGTSHRERETLDVLTALDPRIAIADGCPPELARWCLGKEILAPPSIHGLCVRIEDDAQHASEGVVIAGPGVTPRRVLGLGAPLAERIADVRLRRTQRRQGRVETLVAVLACAGPDGLPEEDCFTETYEIAYERDVHRGLFDVLLVRARSYLESVGEIHKGGGRIALALSRPALVSDPRCAARAHDRLLRMLAREGRTTASEAAKRVGLSVRAVQDALRSLADAGACLSEKDGKRHVYTLEDTTFSDATEQLAFGSPQERA